MRNETSGLVLCIEGANVQDVFRIYRRENGTLETKTVPFQVIDHDILGECSCVEIVEHADSWAPIVSEYVKTQVPEAQEIIDAARVTLELGKGKE